MPSLIPDIASEIVPVLQTIFFLLSIAGLIYAYRMMWS
jgi:hypothetical protein